ncbi:hypothetical protein OC844_007861, partial [Tilletia horrida]
MLASTTAHETSSLPPSAAEPQPQPRKQTDNRKKRRRIWRYPAMASMPYLRRRPHILPALASSRYLRTSPGAIEQTDITRDFPAETQKWQESRQGASVAGDAEGGGGGAGGGGDDTKLRLAALKAYEDLNLEDDELGLNLNTTSDRIAFYAK